MSKTGSRSARTSIRSALVGAAVVMAVSFGAVLVGGGPTAGASTGSTATTGVSSPKGVTTDIGQAREDLQTLDSVLARLGRQEKTPRENGGVRA